MRVQWSDIARAARETSDALNGKDWVNASIEAKVLLADLADEIDRLRAEVAHEREQRDLRHQAYLEGCEQIEAMKIEHDAIANSLADERDRIARERDETFRQAMLDAAKAQREKDEAGKKPREWRT